MGASFIGRDYSVYTTTGGFIELMRALITLGERIASNTRPRSRTRISP